MRKTYRLKGVRILGAPIFVHWSVLLALAMLALSAVQSPVYALIFIASYLGILFVHELGHALLARKFGLAVLAIELGVFHGRCKFEAPDTEWEHVLISWGGVLAQLLIGFAVLVFALLWPWDEYGYFGPVVAFLGYFNLIFVAVNLAPTRGLDGYIAWRIIPLYLRYRHARTSVGKIVKRSKRAR